MDLNPPLLEGLPAHNLDSHQFSATVSYANTLLARSGVTQTAAYLQRRGVFPAGDPATQAELVGEFLIAAAADRLERSRASQIRMEEKRLDREHQRNVLKEAQEDFADTEASIEARAALWPDEATAEVIKFVRNPKLVVVRLEDGREASMWKMGRCAIGAKTRVRIETRLPEPIYEPVRD